MEPMIRIYEAIFADNIALLFSTIIAGWFVVALLVAIVRALAPTARGASLVAITPGSLATLGVLGTFTGILIGLLDFDTNPAAMRESVSRLLDGLKVAFTTSVVGLLAAIVFRVLSVFFRSNPPAEGITPEDIHAALQKIHTTLDEGQIALRHSFDNFSKHMVENNQKAIIEALREVIRDFNEKLTEQFGENFKQLNRAVHKLVEWLDKYKTHVEALEGRLEAALTALEATQKALERVQAHAERIPEAIQALEPVLKGLNGQVEVMEAHMKALAALRDKAVEAFPVIETNIEKLTTTFAARVEEATEKSRQTLRDAEQAYSKLRQDYGTLAEETDRARRQFSEALTHTLEETHRTRMQFSEKLTESMEQLRAHAKQEMTRMEAHHKTLVDATNETRAQFAQQLTDTMKGMSDHAREEMTRMEAHHKTLVDATNETRAQLSQQLTDTMKGMSDHAREEMTRAQQKFQTLAEETDKTR
ncbi:MAG: MotA/TolQ/ExbB proton channel family protein, partial [Rhodobacteraceae bacterium]|nr:MotA/TolQ/ExbB proton channel family protein [Paracoccaceae bacterium]